MLPNTTLKQRLDTFPEELPRGFKRMVLAEEGFIYIGGAIKCVTCDYLIPLQHLQNIGVTSSCSDNHHFTYRNQSNEGEDKVDAPIQDIVIKCSEQCQHERQPMRCCSCNAVSLFCPDRIPVDVDIRSGDSHSPPCSCLSCHICGSPYMEQQ